LKPSQIAPAQLAKEFQQMQSKSIAAPQKQAIMTSFSHAGTTSLTRAILAEISACIQINGKRGKVRFVISDNEVVRNLAIETRYHIARAH
jgi:hypothetical protein